MRPALERAVFVDVETIVDPASYSLERTSARQYITDPRFLILGVAIAVGAGDVRFFWWGAPREADSLRAAVDILREQSRSGAALVAHEAHLDGMILALDIGIRFERMFDTAAYARGIGIGASLANVAQWMGYERTAEAPPFTVQSLSDPVLLQRMATYCATGVALCREVFLRAVSDPEFPDIEFDIIDHTTRLNLRGVRICAQRATVLLETVQTRRNVEIEALALTHPTFNTSDMNSEARVGRYIQSRFGVRMHSLSRKKDDVATAMAQGGELAEFLVRRARLQALSKAVRKVTAYATRKEDRVYGILKFGGAHTGRFAAGGRDSEKLNLHGLGKGKDELGLPELGLERTVIVPDDGRLFCAGDLASIEARIVAWLAGQDDLVERFRSGEDVYSWFAGLIFPGVTITKSGENSALRKLGKEAVLGLGFGMGLPTFNRQVRSKGIPCSDDDIRRAYDIYQASFGRIQRLRYAIQEAFATAVWGQWTTLAGLYVHRTRSSEPAGPHVAITLPTGRTFLYRSVRIEEELTERGLRPVYWFAPNLGGKGKPAAAHNRAKRRRFADGILRDRISPQVLVENVTQAIARDVMAHQVLVLESLGLPVAWHNHDEIIVSCPRCLCSGPCAPGCSWAMAGRLVAEVMTRVPATLPALSTLPLACEMNRDVRETYAQ